MKYALDNKLVNSDTGKWNYRAAFKLLKAEDIFKAKDTLKERKKIAGATTSDKGGETKTPEYKTNQDFKGRNWGDL